jgi:hypothetical protein
LCQPFSTPVVEFDLLLTQVREHQQVIVVGLRVHLRTFHGVR